MLSNCLPAQSIWPLSAFGTETCGDNYSRSHRLIGGSYIEYTSMAQSLCLLGFVFSHFPIGRCIWHYVYPRLSNHYSYVLGVSAAPQQMLHVSSFEVSIL